MDFDIIWLLKSPGQVKKCLILNKVELILANEYIKVD